MSSFPRNSRYFAVAIRQRVAADGAVETFVGRRIIPATARYRALDHYRTQTNDRIDGVANRFYGDPEQYWRICDANGEAEPARVTEPDGRLLLIPMPLEIADDGES